MASNPLNILLFGETGVGKSTFINALLNYLTHEDLNQATKKKLRYFVPTKFSIMDDDLQQKTVCVGCSPDENEINGASTTQRPKTYLLNLGSFTLRLIDSPGIGDTRGMEYDKKNIEQLMYCISQLKNLNAICILFKPDVTRLSPQFEYCFKQILASLDRKAQNNVIFVFTHARSNLGDTVSLINQLLRNIPSITIRPNAENTFYIENDPFRYLVEIACGLKFDKEREQSYGKSWIESTKTCQRLVNYISKLSPVPMQGTVTINEARRVVANLAQPVAEMLALYDNAIDRLQLHKRELMKSQDTITKLKDNLYIPVIKYQIKQIIRTTTDTKTSGWNAGLNCNPRPPYVWFNFGYEQNETSQTCTQEILEPVEIKVEDVSIKAQLEYTKNTAEVAMRKINEINDLIVEYGKEAETVLNAAVEFSIFLQEQAIISYGDLFLMYFEYLLQREQDKGTDADSKILKNLQDLLDRYKQKKNNVSNVSATKILATIEQLINLRHCGFQFSHFCKRVYALEDNSYHTK